LSITENAQENDFDFGELPGLVDKNVTTSTTSMTSVNVTQQALKPQLVGDELLGDDAGSDVDLEEASGDELLTTVEDDVNGTTMKTGADTIGTTISTDIITSSTVTTTMTTTSTTTTTNATLPTFTTEEPVSNEPG